MGHESLPVIYYLLRTAVRQLQFSCCDVNQCGDDSAISWTHRSQIENSVPGRLKFSKIHECHFVIHKIRILDLR